MGLYGSYHRDGIIASIATDMEPLCLAMQLVCLAGVSSASDPTYLDDELDGTGTPSFGPVCSNSTGNL